MTLTRQEAALSEVWEVPGWEVERRGEGVCRQLAGGGEGGGCCREWPVWHSRVPGLHTVSGLRLLWNSTLFMTRCPGHSSPCGPGLVSLSPQNSVPLAVYGRGWDDGLQGPPLLLPLTLQAASGPVELAAAHSLMMSAEQAVGSPAPLSPSL